MDEKIRLDAIKYQKHVLAKYSELPSCVVNDYVLQLLSAKYSTGNPSKFRLSNIKLGWNDPIFNDIMKDQQEQDEFMVNPYNIADGVSVCKKCKSTKTYNVERQSRSLDEPSTVTTVCTSCGHRSRYSG